MKTRLSSSVVLLALLMLARPVYGQQPGEKGVPPAAIEQACASGQCGGIADTGYCDPGCDTGCCETDPGCSVPRWTAYGEFLYIRPRSAEVAYAVPMNGPIVAPPAPPIQIGRYGIVDFDYEPAFRVGMSCATDCWSSLGVQYTHFESHTDDTITTDAPFVIRSLVSHPRTWNAASDGLDARATLDVDFQLMDLEYRGVWLCSERGSLSYLIGASYARLDQDFSSVFGVLSNTLVLSSVNFDGGGVRLGLEGERRICGSGLMVYGKAAARVLGGTFRAEYFQGTLPADPIQVDAAWRAGRLVSILEMETGVGWTSCNGCLRLTGGYMVNAWLNVVKTADWIQAVQTDDLGRLDDAVDNVITFDGFVARAELRY